MSPDTDQSIANRLAQLEATVEALRAENDQLHDRIETLETEVADLRDERDHLTERVDTLQRETAKLRGRIDDCTDLADRVTALETRPHIEWDTKDFDDAVVTHSNGPDYPIGTALANRPQRDEIERDTDTILNRIDAGEVTTHQQDTRLNVAPETPLEELCACPDTIQRQATEKVDIYRAVKFAEELYSRSNQTPYNNKRMIRASDLSRWLATHTDCQTNAAGDRAHGQTITRVIQALDEFGKDGIEVERDGGRGAERRVMIDAELADRCQQYGSATMDAEIVNELNAVDAGHHEPVSG
jgi:regulator of replication initiation timing